MKQNERRSVWKFVGGIGFLVLLVVVLGVIVMSSFFHRPLAEPMTLVQNTATPEAVVANPTATLATVPVEAAKPTETCGNSGAMTVLFVGEDMDEQVAPRGADSVRLAKVDFTNKKITVVAFPRDLQVNTPGLADQDVAESPLGQAYYAKKEATMGADKHRITVATSLVGQTLYDNFGVAPQAYFTLELKDVKDMVDAIGGVEVNVPEAFVSEHNISFAAGTQLMDGKTAWEFVQTFTPGGDAARRQRQNQFIEAMQDKMLSVDMLSKLPDLIKRFDKATVTDLTPKQLTDLACMGKETPKSNVSFYDVDGDLVTQAKGGALVPDVTRVRLALEEWLGE